jgi:CubicO group peptidase (beta-lactamase class C family)
MHKGTLQWGGVYGHTWWLDPDAGVAVIIFTNTAVEGMSGRLPADIEHVVYQVLK